MIFNLCTERAVFSLGRAEYTVAAMTLADSSFIFDQLPITCKTYYVCI